MEKKKTTVHVAGRDYTLASLDPTEHVQRVGVYVDRKIQEIEAATKLPSNMVAVLAALNIGDELLKTHDENTRLRRELMLARQQLRAYQKKEGK
jgi:cell division protein ZapA